VLHRGSQASHRVLVIDGGGTNDGSDGSDGSDGNHGTDAKQGNANKVDGDASAGHESERTSARLVTCVIGAGPAGLLFSILARIRAEQRGVADRFSLSLFDKRASYARTHRLRIAPEPYLAIQQHLHDPRFDRVIAFLQEQRFSPSVNALEEHLERALAECGVHKQLLAVESAADLAALRERCGAHAHDVFTIVGADSVHSTVRELVAGSLRPTAYRHQQVARLRIFGDDLPDALGALQQYKLSKALGSILDYRKNDNGFGEVDLFLDPSEHEAVATLGATPKEMVRLLPTQLSRVRAPLFRRIVEHLALGFGAGPCEVHLQSTFRLEHTIMAERAFFLSAPLSSSSSAAPSPARAPSLPLLPPPLHIDTAFLVGDAAVSLPFFRGMACLARCTDALAQRHVSIATALLGADAAPLHPGAPTRVGATTGEIASVVSDAMFDYEHDVDRAIQDELRVVRARAALIAGVREFVRVSALVPFPMQSWFLSIPAHDAAPPARWRPSPGTAFNVALAVLALSVAFLEVWTPSFLLELAGGFAYRASVTFEPAQQRSHRRVWQAHGAALLFVGVALCAHASWTAHALTQPRLAIWWFVLALPFIAGMYGFEALGRRFFARAAFDDDRARTRT
jgi:hypothetical protein